MPIPDTLQSIAGYPDKLKIHMITKSSVWQVRYYDGRVVRIPKGYYSKEGSDGRVVAVPKGRHAAEGPNGRVKLLPKR